MRQETKSKECITEHSSHMKLHTTENSEEMEIKSKEKGFSTKANESNNEITLG